jgi:hypothetical protein
VTGFRTAVGSISRQSQIARAPFGGAVIIHATTTGTGGTVAMSETFARLGGGPALHTNTRETEVCRVLQGTFRF